MPRFACKHPAGLVLPGASSRIEPNAEADLTKEQAETAGVKGWIDAGYLVPVKTGK
jgi:hypothetical protein